MNINFVSSLNAIKTEYRYIFVMICYFSRFIILFVIKNNNVKDVL